MDTYGGGSHGALNSNPLVDIPMPPGSYPHPQHQTFGVNPQRDANYSRQTAGNDLPLDRHIGAPFPASIEPPRGLSYSWQQDPNMPLGQYQGSGSQRPPEGVRDGGSEGYKTAPTTPEMSGVSAPDSYGRGPEGRSYPYPDSRNIAPVAPPRPFPDASIEPHFSPAHNHNNRIPATRSNTYQGHGGGYTVDPRRPASFPTPLYDSFRTSSPTPAFNQARQPNLNSSVLNNKIPIEKNYIYFYDAGATYYEFTNFSPDPVAYEDKVYPTSEHLFQAMKFIKTRPLLAEHIRTCSDRPREAFMEARRFQPEWDPDWHSDKIKRMDQVLELKFTSTLKLRDLLLDTGDAILVEDSPVDDFWGAGADRKGKNELGLALMRLRSKLRDASRPYSGDLIEM